MVRDILNVNFTGNTPCSYDGKTDLREDIQNASCKTEFFLSPGQGQGMSEMDWPQGIDTSQLGYNSL